MYNWNDGSVLQHHGILGQKWGIRRFQNPDGTLTEAGKKRYGSDSGGNKSGKKEKNAINKNSAKDDDLTKNNNSKKVRKTLKEKYNLSDEDIELYKEVAKVVGVSLAATAGVLAVSYVIHNRSKINPEEVLSSISGNSLNNINTTTGENYIDQVNQVPLNKVVGFNSNSFLKTTVSINDINNVESINGLKPNATIGNLAKLHGYEAVNNGKDLINKAIPIQDDFFLHRDVIVNQRGSVRPLDRRLSCWSGSHSYLLSMLTGKQYCSRNYQDLVEFNTFGDLYNKPMSIIDMFGNSKTDFVGKMGSETNITEKVQKDDAYKLINTIYSNFTKPNAKNGSVVGFIDAAYRKSTCTHQWNFEVTNNGVLNIVDAWSGEKYNIANKLSDGTIKYNENNLFVNKGSGDSFLTEMMHYGRDSFRLYSPSLEDLNLDKISNIVLAKTH